MILKQRHELTQEEENDLSIVSLNKKELAVSLRLFYLACIIPVVGVGYYMSFAYALYSLTVFGVLLGAVSSLFVLGIYGIRRHIIKRHMIERVNVRFLDPITSNF